MARTTIFPTQEISYDFLFMDMVPAASIIPAPFALEPGQTYAVQWGDTLFENLSVIDLADAGFTGGAIGNCSGFELPGNNEPFAIAYFADDTGGEIVVFFLDGNVSQTITVYQESAESPLVLKDRTGTDIEYEGVEGVRVFDKAGNPHVFVPPVETEEKTVELDFSGGAMEVTPSEGKLLSKVGISVPETLSPENIAKDVDIAGIIGTLAGGSNAKAVSHTFTMSSAGSSYTWQHNLGVVPDVFLVVSYNGWSTTSYLLAAIGFSRALIEKVGIQLPQLGFTSSGTTALYYNNAPMDANSSGPPLKATAQTVIIGNGSPKLAARQYNIFAITGLT